MSFSSVTKTRVDHSQQNGTVSRLNMETKPERDSRKRSTVGIQTPGTEQGQESQIDLDRLWDCPNQPHQSAKVSWTPCSHAVDKWRRRGEELLTSTKGRGWLDCEAHHVSAVFKQAQCQPTGTSPFLIRKAGISKCI